MPNMTVTIADPRYQRGSTELKFEEITFLESLGSGEFGHVFRGIWRGAEVAVKQLFWDGNYKTDGLRELRREVESFRNLNTHDWSSLSAPALNLRIFVC